VRHRAKGPPGRPQRQNGLPLARALQPLAQLGQKSPKAGIVRGPLNSACRLTGTRTRVAAFWFLALSSALKPPLGHPLPRSLAGRVARGLGHLLAFGGVLEKFVSWIDRSHERSLLGFPVPSSTQYRWPTKTGKRRCCRRGGLVRLTDCLPD
jgi:hypothetical protein